VIEEFGLDLKVGRIGNDNAFIAIPHGGKITTGEKVQVELFTIDTTDFK